MGLENFSPEIWAASLLVPFRKALVHGSLVNRDYEGQITDMGDTVRINEIGAVTVGNYTKNSDITWQDMDGAQKMLLIDQQKYFAVNYDDVDKAQDNPKLMDGFMAEAAYRVADTVDQFIATQYAYAGSTVSAVTVTAGNVLQNLSNFQLKLDEANVPTSERFIVVPPWYNQYLVLAASASISATAVPKVFSDSLLVNGYVGNLFGLNILMSNNVNNNSTVYNMMAFHRSAITFAGQITRIEAVRRENRFGEGVKGLYTYGAKVVKPYGLVSCAATRG